MKTTLPFDLRLVLAAAVLALGAGCTVQADGTDVGTEGEEIIGGTKSYGQPEILQILGANGGFCSGTLVAPRVVLTAAHCSVNLKSPMRIAIDAPTGKSRSYYAVQTAYYNPLWDKTKQTDTANYVHDVGLMRLTQVVPSSVATPRAMTNQGPANGQHMTIWGYSSTSRTSDVEVGIKHYADFSAGQTIYLVWHGDSGGPVIRGDNGAIFRVNSMVGTGSGNLNMSYCAPLNANWDWIQKTLSAIK